ncbi:hypothetical protein Tco_0627992 [Tanacetum coccineum]|uniref:Uncharacterized protein n=1 Tax=Tanacetum coccineum TaxID=301880 RepID=A0ABQ4WNZ8_9ASTR
MSSSENDSQFKVNSSSISKRGLEKVKYDSLKNHHMVANHTIVGISSNSIGVGRRASLVGDSGVIATMSHEDPTIAQQDLAVEDYEILRGIEIKAVIRLWIDKLALRCTAVTILSIVPAKFTQDLLRVCGVRILAFDFFCSSLESISAIEDTWERVSSGFAGEKVWEDIQVVPGFVGREMRLLGK